MTGNGVPEPSLGKDGDSYLDLETWDFYVKEDLTWVLSGNIKGESGSSVTILSIELSGSEGNVDTYTITFSDGETFNFTVINGEDGAQGIQGEPGEDGHTPVINVGENGNWYIDGVDTGCPSQGPSGNTPYIGENGNWWIEGVDTGFSSKGTDGDTPYIGENGNWWIDSSDTGVLADASKGGNEDVTDGLVFQIETYKGEIGAVITEYKGEATDVTLPNFIGTFPVIGIAEEAFYRKPITSITLSSNLLFLGEKTFGGCSYLTSVDFNGCQIEMIPTSAFASTGLEEIQLPQTVTTLEDYCFSDTPLRKINLDNITYYGNSCLVNYAFPYVYLDNAVTYVGDDAFSYPFIYLEEEEIPDTWGNIDGNKGEVIGEYATPYITTGCAKNEEYIYKITEEAEITIYQYLGDDVFVKLPDTIYNLPVTTLGFGFGGYKGEYDEIQIDYLPEYVEIKLPDTIQTIDLCVLNGLKNTLIYFPSSIETFLYPSLNVGRNLAFAFEGAEIPTSLLDIESSYPNLTSTYRTSIAYDDLHYIESKDLYLYCNKESSSYFYCRNSANALVLNLSANIEDYHAQTIAPYFIYEDANIATLVLDEGISKIQAEAISLKRDGVIVSISSDLTIINANGIIVGNNAKIYIEHMKKPAEWDTYWYRGNAELCWGYTINDLRYTDDLIYAIRSDDTVILINYLDLTDMHVYIPRELDGKPVTAIASDFYLYSRNSDYIYFYIPSSIETIDETAFTCYRAYFYCEADSQPDGWDGYWKSSTYGSVTWGYDFSEIEEML